MSEQETHQPTPPIEPDPVAFKGLLRRFHQSMAVVCSLGLIVIYSKWGSEEVLPYLLGSALVWVNMVVLAFGVRGVFNQQRSLVFVLLLKFGLLIGGVYVLSQIFPEQQIGLLFGCSTWVLASILVGQGGAIKTGATAALCMLILSATTSPDAYAKPTEAEMLEGEVHVRTVKVKGSPMPKIIAEGIIKSAVKDVWAVVSDCGNFKNTMENVLESKFHGIVKGKKRCEIVVDLPWPISNLRSLVAVKLTERPDGVKVRTWSLVEGDYHKNSGEWRLSPRKDGYTFVRYMVHVEPKVSIPDWIQRSAQKSKIPNIFENLSEVMKKRGKLLP